MAEMIDYALPLRAIGQALELMKMENFELEPDGDDFIVRGKVAARLHFSRGRERDLEASQIEPVTTPPIVNPIDLCYTLKDVERLDQKGRARRGETPTSADSPSLSHLLRTIGAYLEGKPARLVKIVRHEGSVTIVYETLSGVTFEEKPDRVTLCEWEAQSLVKRGGRHFQ